MRVRADRRFFRWAVRMNAPPLKGDDSLAELNYIARKPWSLPSLMR